MTSLSPAAEILILNAEVGSQAEYKPRPAWPGGASGVTVGIGYDLGYAGPGQVAADWGPYLDGGTVKRLQQVAGIKGNDARIRAQALQDVSVPWGPAKAVFDSRDIPRAIAATRQAFPGADALPGDSFGVLVGIVFNRGSLVSSTDPRRIEMLQIRDALAEARPADIPAYIRAMKRLWPAGTDQDGLRTRRDAEASLFAAGLASA